MDIFSLIAALSSVLIYLSIPNGAHFNYTYRLGQIWLEEDLYSPQDFVLPKSNQELAADREFLIETKDYYYDYHYRLDEWSNSLALDSTLQLQLKSWQKGDWLPIFLLQSIGYFLRTGYD